MSWLKNLFKKKEDFQTQKRNFRTESEIYAHMGSLGISPEQLKNYEEAMKMIKEGKR